MDVSDRRRPAADLDADESRYRELAEALPQLVWTTRPDGLCDYLSSQWIAYTGVPEADHRGHGWLQAIHPDDRAHAFAVWTAAVEGRGRYDLEYRIRRHDGVYRWFKTRGVPVRGPRGDIVRWLGTCTDIEDQKRAEEDVRRSEERFRTALKNSPIVVFNQDRELRYTWIHNSALGYTHEEVLGKRDGDLFERAEDAIETEAIKRRVLTTGVGERREVSIHWRGVRRAYDLNVEPLRDVSGTIVGVTCAAVDVTDRRQAREALRVTQARLMRMMDTDVVAIGFGDAEGRIFEANDAFAHLTGYSREELLAGNMAWTQITAPEYAELDRHLMLQLARTGIIGPYEKEYVRKDGRRVPVLVSIARLSGDPEEHVAFVLDNTARRRAELDREALRKALEDSEARFRGLATSNVIGILACDPEMVIDANAAFLDLIGYTREELLAGSIRWRSLTPPEYTARDEQGLDELIRTGTCRPFAKEYVRRDGTRVPVLLGATVVSREPFEWVCFVINATAQRRAEEQLRRAQKLEAVGQLAGGVAHEVNNMMAVVIGFGDFVLKRLGPDHPSTADVSEMVRAANRAAGVTRQLLAFSRRQLMQPEVLDLNVVVDELKSLLERLLGADKQLWLALAPSVGPVLVDRGQLEQVIVNLALNARDAMRPGGAIAITTAEVTLGTEMARERGVAVRPGRYAQVSVTDDGSGMSEETRLRAFEPFFTTKPVGQGTGLGLSTVYGIVKQSGGYVWIDSELGRGTTVTVHLPVTRRGAASLGTAATADPATGSGQETVLVVEDEGLVRRMAARALEVHGYTVLEAEHGRDAQEVLTRNGKVDVVVTDLVMPELNGNELGRWLREQRPELPVLYMSGYTDADVVERGLLDAAAPFIQKPFGPDELAQRVRELLDA